MTWVREFLARASAALTRRRLDDRLRAEIAEHIALQTEDNLRAGMMPAEARRQALLTFGPIEPLRDAYQDQNSIPHLDHLLRDVQYGWRTLRHAPAFTVVAVLTLAVGVGATTAMFSVVDGVLLEPLAYPNPNQLMAVHLSVPKMAQKFPMVPVNPAAYLGWSRHATSLAGIGLVEDGVTMNLTSGGDPVLLRADAVTSNVFDVLGVEPFLGRNFLANVNQAGHNHEVILTHALWLDRFRGDPAIVGRPIGLNGNPFVVVGVLPPGFYFPRGEELAPMGSSTVPELFVPEVFDQWELAPDAGFGFGAIARLRPGVSQAHATAELDVILNRALGSQSFMPDPRTTLIPLRDMIVRSSKRTLWILFAAILAVLLIICVNLANLMLTRASAREHESAVRRALGATRGRLLSQALIEMLLVGVIGGALGLLFAYWGLGAVLSAAPMDLPRVENVRLDGPVVWFTLAVSILAGLLAGLVPAWRAARVDPQHALWSGGMRSGESGVRLRAREFLVGLETALSTVLLIAAGLLIGSFAKLISVPDGFAADHVLTVDLQLPSAQYAEKQRRAAFWQAVLASTSALPGIESSAIADWLPLSGGSNNNPVNLPGDTRPAAERPFAIYRSVSPDYFKVLGIPLWRGRALTPADAATHAVVISTSAAEDIWPGVDPIGQRFDVDAASGFPGYQVVGIVGDTRNVSLSKAPIPVVYRLYASGSTGSLIVRSRSRATGVASELRDAISTIDRGVAVPAIVGMGDIVSASVASERFETMLIAVFALAALVLASLGIYGVVSFAVVRRTREMGIRMALGARKAEVMRRMVAHGMKPALLGLAGGLLGGLALAHLLSSLLFDITARDPLTFIVVSLALTGVSALASYVPARRATRLDPMAALRDP